MVGTLLREGDLTFSVFFSHLGTEIEAMNSVERGLEPEETGRYVSMSMLYLFRKASLEIREFNSATVVKKHMIEEQLLVQGEVCEHYRHGSNGGSVQTFVFGPQ